MISLLRFYRDFKFCIEIRCQEAREKFPGFKAAVYSIIDFDHSIEILQFIFISLGN